MLNPNQCRKAGQLIHALKHFKPGHEKLIAEYAHSIDSTFQEISDYIAGQNAPDEHKLFIGLCKSYLFNVYTLLCSICALSVTVHTGKRATLAERFGALYVNLRAAQDFDQMQWCLIGIVQAASEWMIPEAITICLDQESNQAKINRKMIALIRECLTLIEQARI